MLTGNRSKDLAELKRLHGYEIARIAAAKLAGDAAMVDLAGRSAARYLRLAEELA